MQLSAMKYGNYTWPHNPRVYEIFYNRRVVCHKMPFGCYTLQNLGREQRILRGQGEFSGAGAYDEFKKLATEFYREEPQVLVHPVWQSARAWFVHLELKQEPREDYVRYEFEFWECYDGYENAAQITVQSVKSETVPEQTEQRKSHTIKSGETLWGLAAQNGMTVTELMALNPQIKNFNVYYVGDVVYLS